MSWLVILTVVLAGHPLRAAQRQWGTDPTGGEGGELVEVTTLADSGPGSLRAVVGGGHRQVRFRVGGMIRLRSALTVRGSHLTIDGRDAPTPGVTVAGKPFILQDAEDVILRGLRFRQSDDDDVRLVGACRNVLIEQCSMTHGGDGALDITVDYRHPERRPQDVTVRWCLLAATKKAMLVVGARRLSLHHNLFTNNDQRNPQLHGVSGFDFRRNVVRWWGVYGLRARAGSTGNVVGNVFTVSARRKPLSAAVVLVREGDGACGPVHVADNLGPGGPLAMPHSSPPQPRPAGIEDAGGDLFDLLRRRVGARPLDAIDTRLVAGDAHIQPRPSMTQDH